EALDVRHGAVQLGFTSFQAYQALTRRPSLPYDFGPPARPLGGRNEIGVWIGIAPTVPHPDIARPQGAAEVPQGAQFIIPAADGPVLLSDVGPPRLGDEAHR